MFSSRSLTKSGFTFRSLINFVFIFVYGIENIREYSNSILFLKKDIYFLWLLWVFIVAYGLFLVVASRSYSSLWSMGFSLRWLLLLWSMGSMCSGFIYFLFFKIYFIFQQLLYAVLAQQLWLIGSRALVQQLLCTGLTAP